MAKSSPLPKATVAPSILRRSRGSSKARNQSFDEQSADLCGSDSRCEPAMLDHRNQSVDDQIADLCGIDSRCEPAMVDRSCCTPNKTPPDRLSFSPSEVYLYLEGTFLSLYIMHVYFIKRSMPVGILKVIGMF